MMSKKLVELLVERSSAISSLVKKLCVGGGWVSEMQVS